MVLAPSTAEAEEKQTNKEETVDTREGSEISCKSESQSYVEVNNGAVSCIFFVMKVSSLYWLPTAVSVKFLLGFAQRLHTQSDQQTTAHTCYTGVKTNKPSR